MRRTFFLLLFPAIAGIVCGGAESPGSITGDAVVLGDVVNVRRAPHAGAAVVATVREGDKVVILSWESGKVTIGTLTDRWARVRLGGGGNGYVFGGFLFELAGLTDGVWGAMHFGGGSGFKLLANGTYEEDAVLDTGQSRATGRWVLAGRRLVFTPASGSGISGRFLHRYKGLRCLTCEKMAPGTPDSGYQFPGAQHGRRPLDVYFQVLR